MDTPQDPKPQSGPPQQTPQSSGPPTQNQSYTPSYAQPTAPSGPPMQQAPQAPAAIKHSRAGLIVGIVVAALLVGGGAWAFFSGVFTSKEPYEVMAEMLDAIDELESGETVATFTMGADLQPVMDAYYEKREEAKKAHEAKEVEAPPAPPTDDPFGLSYRSSYQRMTPDQYRYGRNFDRPHELEELGLDRIDIELVSRSYGNFEAGEGARQAGEFSLDSQLIAATISHRKVDDSIYLQLSDVSFGDVTTFPTAMFTPFLEVITSQWILIDLEEIFPKSFMEQVNEKQDQAEEELEEVLPEFKESFLEHRPLILTEAEDGERGFYVYDVDIDLEKLELFLNDVAEITGDAKIRSQHRNKEMRMALEKIDEAIDDLEYQIAVDKKTMLPAWVRMSGQLVPPEDFEEFDEVEGLVVDLGLEVEFGKFNEEFDIDHPENAKTVQELMEEIMGGFMGGALGEPRIKARDSKRLSDLKQLQTALELFYTDSNRYPASEGAIQLGLPNTACLSASGFTTAGCSNAYMGLVPTDPTLGEYYVYEAAADGSTYTLKATLEMPVGNLEAGPVVASPSGIINKKKTDTDGDTLSDELEAKIGSDPNKADTDDDGFNDAAEIMNGYNPMGEGSLSPEDAESYKAMYLNEIANG